MHTTTFPRRLQVAFHLRCLFRKRGKDLRFHALGIVRALDLQL